ncbi:DUF1800 domain-containing protein [Vibrio sp. WXL210]|uniref:DUF1800 domain-containing protein n=1 Tax=Vibrio sp. WXL210 TaxID=3450709 RepID=UPI003EC6DF4B
MDRPNSYEASRFLQRATFGVKQDDVEELQRIGVQQWLAQQYAVPASLHEERGMYQKAHRRNQKYWPTVRVSAWFDIAIWGDDQLRQRMAFALSQLLVVSQKDANLASEKEARALARYYDLLVTHAFGSYAELLYQVARSPVMGIYLTHAGNRSFSSAGVEPDQNFARELMQLFTTSDFALEDTGQIKLDANGRAIENYDEEQVAELARVFTGWDLDKKSLLKPMRNRRAHHDKGQKQLHGVTLAANRDADAELRQVISILVNHPSTAPYISTFLINRFVSSNPSGDYVARVTKVFRQTEGNLGETLTAVLTDDEVFKPRNVGNIRYRDTLLRLTYFFRALEAYPGVSSRENQSSDRMFYASGKFVDYRDGFNQTPLGAPSVFNFFSPEYSPQGELADAQLFAPELEIMEWIDIAEVNDIMYRTITKFNDTVRHGKYFRTDERTYIALSPYYWLARRQGPDALVDRVSTTLLNGRASPALRATLTSLYSERRKEQGNKAAVNDVLLLTLLSTDFSIEG